MNQNKKVQAHFKKMQELNSELMNLGISELNEIEQRYQFIIGMVQTLVIDNRVLSLSELLQKEYPEYGASFPIKPKVEKRLDDMDMIISYLLRDVERLNSIHEVMSVKPVKKNG